MSDFSEASLKFAKQLGVTHLKINSGELMDERQRGPVQLPKLLDAKKKVEAYGLQIGVVLLPQGVGSQHWNIRLGRPEREQEKGSVPRFDESFIDDGDVDMLEALRTYKEVEYTGTIMPDHWPGVVGDSPLIGHAHALGYLKALMDALGVYDG